MSVRPDTWQWYLCVLTLDSDVCVPCFPAKCLVVWDTCNRGKLLLIGLPGFSLMSGDWCPLGLSPYQRCPHLTMEAEPECFTDISYRAPLNSNDNFSATATKKNLSLFVLLLGGFLSLKSPKPVSQISLILLQTVHCILHKGHCILHTANCTRHITCCTSNLHRIVGALSRWSNPSINAQVLWFFNQEPRENLNNCGQNYQIMLDVGLQSILKFWVFLSCL